jgi:hypothetical protein
MHTRRSQTGACQQHQPISMEHNRSLYRVLSTLWTAPQLSGMGQSLSLTGKLSLIKFSCCSSTVIVSVLLVLCAQHFTAALYVKPAWSSKALLCLMPAVLREYYRLRSGSLLFSVVLLMLKCHFVPGSAISVPVCNYACTAFSADIYAMLLLFVLYCADIHAMCMHTA